MACCVHSCDVNSWSLRMTLSVPALQMEQCGGDAKAEAAALQALQQALAHILDNAVMLTIFCAAAAAVRRRR